MKTLKASVLITVVTVSFLMLLFVCGMLLLKEYSNRPLRQWITEQQERMWLDSAFRMYCRDTGGKFADTSAYVLFPPDGRTRVRAKVLPWGLYEVVTMTLASGNYSVRWIGKKRLSEEGVQLYVSDRDAVFHLAGHTVIRGKAALPRSGVAYTAMNAEFFSGEVLEDSVVCRSGQGLPEPVREMRERAEEYCRLPEPAAAIEDEETGRRQSFRKETLTVTCRERLAGSYAGHILLYSRSALYIGPECRLDGVLVSAPSVVIGKGFRGDIQVFARDTVVVDRQVELAYPSGIFMCAENPERRVEIRDSAVVNGYVIIDGEQVGEASPLLHYRQAVTAKVRGVIYVGGIAQMQGKVAGALFLRDSYFFSPAGYYTDILYGTEVLENKAVIWPFWLKGDPEKEVIVCLE